uniref:transposase n=1 Tax=Rickettsia endosymbiont of Urophora cardui TaxID=3066265 RepID=UPI00313E3BD7
MNLIKTQLQELYGAEISESLISRITDEVIDEVKIWQSRPLESVYPIVYFDCLVVKVRQDKLINDAPRSRATRYLKKF